MRIAVLETSIVGGLLHYAAQLADGLGRRGHEVDLIVPSGNELATRVGDLHFRMRSVLPRPLRTIGEPRAQAAYFLRRAEIAARLSAGLVLAVWQTRRGGYDAVIVNCDISLAPATLAAWAMTTGSSRPVVSHVCHNVRVFNRGRGDHLFARPQFPRPVFAKALGRFDVVFVHGDRSRREFQELWASSRVAIIPHGDERLFADEPPPPASEERVLFFGEWRKIKGLGVLMTAFDRLVEQRPNARLTIAGRPAPNDLDPEPILTWAAGHGDRVEIVDRYVPMEDVPGLFGRARVVTTPYLAGFQSGVLHLAMTMSRAVVVSDVGDLGSVVENGRTGYVVSPGDADQLADALAGILADGELASRMGAEGRRRMLQSANWDQVAKLVEEALEEGLRARSLSVSS